jgi:hypothetical protein
MDAREVSVYLAFIWNQSPRNGASFVQSPNCRTYRLPSCIGNPDASNLDRQAALLHGLNPYRCEPSTDEAAHCLDLEPAGKQSIHIAAMRRPSEHYEHAAMAQVDVLVFGLRDHIAGRADLRAAPPF